jgi:hypothetical protein
MYGTNLERRIFENILYELDEEKKVVGLERGPLSLVSTTQELLDSKVAAPVYKTENTALGIHLV